jgi:hypothetical protein
MDTSPPGLVPIARMAASLTNRLCRLREEIEMESIPAHKATPTTGKLSDSAIDYVREQGRDTIRL